MGIRLGILVAKAPAADVVRELVAQYGALPTVSRVVKAEDAGDVLEGSLLVGEHDGVCVISDPELVLGSDDDLSVEIGQSLGCLAATLLTESTTQSHQLVVADGSGLRRAFFCCGESGAGPAYLGQPLAGEARSPLGEATMGEELLELLESEGLGMLHILENGPWQVLEPSEDWVPVRCQPGPIAHALRAQVDRVQQSRHAGGLGASRKATKKGNWLKRLFGRE